MIYLRLSFLLILIASALLLSGASSELQKAQPSPKHQSDTDTNTRNKKQTADKTPSTINKTESEETTKKSYSYYGTYNYYSSESSNWAIVVGAIATIIIAAFAGGQVWFLWKTMQATQLAANAAKESATIADSSLKFAQRAYLDVSFEEDYVPKPDIPVEINWKINNSGQTRGKITHMDVRFHVASGLPEKFEITNKKSGVIVPGNGHRIPRVGYDKMLSRDEVDALFNRGKNLAIYGLILYRDIFNVQHFSRFCWVWDRRARSGKGGFVFPIEADPELNDAD